MLKFRNPKAIGYPLCIISIFIFVVSCGAPQKETGPDPRALMLEGRYEEARQVLLDKEATKRTAEGQALIALSLVAELPNARGRDLAKKVLFDAMDLGTPGDVLLLLCKEADLLPATIDLTVSTFLVETALGSIGLEPGRPAKINEKVSQEKRHMIATKLTFLLATSVERKKGSIPLDRIYALWHTGLALIMDSSSHLIFPKRPLFAYETYLAHGSLAGSVGIAAHASNQAKEMTEVAVLIVEHNPSIRVSVECDLRSPVDKLRKAMAYDRPRLVRLERALAEAKGCTRGTYEPE